MFLAIAYLGYTGFKDAATYYYEVGEFLAQESSVYKNNKDLVDKLRDNGMDMTKAIEFVSELKGSDNVAQPITSKAPGVVEAGRAVSAPTQAPKVEVSAQDMRIFKQMGLTDKEIQTAAKEAAKDMVNG